MKKNMFPPTFLILLSFLLSFHVKAKDFDPVMEASVKNRIESLSSCVHIKYTEEVKDRVYYLVEKHRAVGEALLGKSTMYFPLFEGVFKEKGIPADLKYIAVIESGLNPAATSRSQAAGLWQFVKPTAKYMGLSITKAVDERRDPIKSTYAAADYLMHLYEIYHDWTMAIAAYNCGPGNVNKAIARSGGKTTYWEICDYLPRETQQYVPKFIAMSYLMNYYYMHNMKPIMISPELSNTASVRVYDKVDLMDIAKEFDIDFEVIKKLNPSYTKNFIPASKGDHYLTLPEDKLYSYLDKRNAYEDLFHVAFLVQEDATSTIAESFMQQEPIQQVDRDYIEKLPILGNVVAEAIRIEDPIETYQYVKLKHGQSLKSLAEEYEIPLTDLIVLNGFDEENMPGFGDLIKVVN